jgi:hypothetical protein
LSKTHARSGWAVFSNRSALEAALREERPDPPLFPWRSFLPVADEIIERVRKDVKRAPAKEIRPPRPGLDLSAKRDSIAHLLMEVHERYLIARDDYRLRNGLNEGGQFDKALLPTKSPPRTSDSQEYDYGEFAHAGFESWEQNWQHDYGRRRGNPGHSRSCGPPLLPLHSVYPLIKGWWRQHGLGQFNPTFSGGDDESENNPPSRFLLCILQGLDPRYTVENARGLYETMRKK